tara:strand:- start:2804 stop:3226 length:423 start_codon:yes stop_codon:yes gene_type:complete
MNTKLAQVALNLSSDLSNREKAPAGTPNEMGFSNAGSTMSQQYVALNQAAQRNDQNLRTSKPQLEAQLSGRDKALEAARATDAHRYTQEGIAFRNTFMETKGLLPENGYVAAMGALNKDAQLQLLDAVRATAGANQMNLA